MPTVRFTATADVQPMLINWLLSATTGLRDSRSMADIGPLHAWRGSSMN
jgi:hypothetical protein